MYQYSGPGSQMVTDSWNNGARGNGCLWEMYMAGKGFICVCVDGRGTGGRGAAFEKCTYMQLGVKEAHDQVETAQYLSTLPYVKKDAIGIWGWSFGGYNTLMSMSEGTPVFAVGVAVAPPDKLALLRFGLHRTLHAHSERKTLKDTVHPQRWNVSESYTASCCSSMAWPTTMCTSATRQNMAKHSYKPASSLTCTSIQTATTASVAATPACTCIRSSPTISLII